MSIFLYFLQWGYSATIGTTTVIFPISFTSVPRGLACLHGNLSAEGIGVYDETLSSMTISSNSGYHHIWIAIGV